MTYEEMIDYLISKEVVAAYNKIRKLAEPLIRCSSCQAEANLPSQHYLQNLSKNALQIKYDYVKKIVDTKLG